MTDEHAFLELRTFLTPEFVFGTGSAWLAGRYCENLGARRVLLVTDPGVREAGWAVKVEESLADDGIQATTFAAVSSNPRAAEVMDGGRLYAAERCEGIVALGGGSVIDCAKGIAVVAGSGRDVRRFAGVDKVRHACPPLVCIPTTAGSGSDVSQFAVIKDEEAGGKLIIASRSVVPDASLVDPLLTATLPRELTATCGLDALCHALEAYVSNAASPMSDLYALKALTLVGQSLCAAFSNGSDLAARGRMMLGSLYAGLAFSNAVPGAVHALAHPVSAALDLHHGRCNAALLEEVIAFNFEAAPGRYVAAARALGAEMPEDITAGAPPVLGRDALLALVRGLKARLGVTDRLSSLGVRPEDLDGLAAQAEAAPYLLTNPRPLSRGDLAEIYAQAL